MAQEYRVTLIEGDGIGPEICRGMRRVLAATGLVIEFEEGLAGLRAVEKCNETLPQDTLALIQKNRVAIKGPLTTPVGKGFGSVNVLLRKKFKLFANVRPVKSFPKVSRFSNVDLVIMRENTEGLYSGLEHEVVPGVVESIKVITREASTRIARYAFDYAQKNGRKKVTAIHKANIMKLSDGLFIQCAQEVAKDFPQIEYKELIVDNACMQLVIRPEQFDVLLLENLYGDIVSDLCAGLVGGLGVVAGANIGTEAAIFEAVHGSAPDIAGKGIANPMALILSSALMLRHLGETKAADAVEKAVNEVIGAGTALTPDLGGKASTDQVAEEIAKKVKEYLK